MAILPDDIEDVGRGQDAAGVCHAYIRYMREQLEFWNTNQQKELIALKARVSKLEEELNEE